MLQRTIVALLLVVGAVCLGYAGMYYHPPGMAGGDSWLLALLVGGILTPASLLHLTGIAYTDIGFSLRDNWSGRLLGNLTRNEKSPDAELAHCALYASGLMTGVIGLVLLICIAGGVLGIQSIISGWNDVPAQSTPVDWGAMGMASGYLILGFVGLAVAVGALIYFTKFLSKQFGWNSETVFSTLAGLTAFGVLVFIVASTSKGDIGVLGAMWAVIRICAFGLGVGILMLVSVALIASPLWAHIAIKKFFPNLYVRICPIVRDTLRPKSEQASAS